MSKKALLLDVLVIILTNICIIVFGIWISAIPVTKSKTFYLNQFDDNQIVHRRLERWYPNEDPDKILNDIADLTINYYFGNAEEYQYYIDGEEFFNEHEVRHMKDVKDLYVGGQIIAVICFFILIACIFYLAKHFRRIKRRIVFTTLGFYLAVIIALGGFVLYCYTLYSNGVYDSFFRSLFINFHHIIFPNEDKFLLATSQGPYNGALYTLTTILDLNFFMNAGIIIGIVTGAVILIWFIIIAIFVIKHKRIAKKVDDMHERAKTFEQRMHQA